MRRFGQTVSIMSCFMLILTASTHQAHAFLNLSDLPQLSYEKEESDQELAKRMEIHEEKPFGDETLAMKITLPIGWIRYETESENIIEKKVEFEKTSEQEGGDIFRILAKYSTPPRIQRRSEFRIRSIELNRLVSLENWFIEFTIQMGFSPEGVKKISEDKLEAQYTIFEYGEPLVVRTAIERSGNKIILAEYLVHQENYEAEKDEQIKAIQDFKMVSPSDDLPIPLNTYTFIDIAKFEYPQTWILYSPGITTIERMEASVINIKNANETDKKSYNASSQLNGRIDISVISKYTETSIEKEVANIGQALKMQGLILGKKIDTMTPSKVHNKIISATVSTYHITPPQEKDVFNNKFSNRSLTKQQLADYEYWLAILETGGRYYFIRLLTIGREEDFKSWSENTEVLKVLISSISPVNDQVH